MKIGRLIYISIYTGWCFGMAWGSTALAFAGVIDWWQVVFFAVFTLVGVTMLLFAAWNLKFLEKLNRVTADLDAAEKYATQGEGFYNDLMVTVRNAKRYPWSKS